MLFVWFCSYFVLIAFGELLAGCCFVVELVMVCS